jgi:hypothetical protein
LDLIVQDVPKIAIRRLRDAEIAEGHPDANLLTAFAERSLAEGEQARLVTHLATCRDCRDVIALALPPTEEVALAAVSSRTGDEWFSWPVLRWGLVAAGVLVVASVGVVQYKQAQEKSKSDLAILTARNAAPAERQAISPPAAEARVAVPQAAAPKPAEGLKKLQSNRPLRGSFSAAGTAKMATPTATTPAPGRDDGVPSSSQMVEVQSEAAPAATARNEVSDQLIASNAQTVQAQAVTQGDVVKAKPAAPLTPSVVLDPANSPLQKEMQPPRWTISSIGALQRSFDEGNTWENVSVNPTAGQSKRATAAAETYGKREKNDWSPPSSSLVFRSVAALGTEVWAGGSGGALYHSGDSGAHWTRVVPSSGEAVLSGDISRIEFSDLQHGTVATSTGEDWLTADGGLSWRRQ